MPAMDNLIYVNFEEKVIDMKISSRFSHILVDFNEASVKYF